MRKDAVGVGVELSNQPLDQLGLHEIVVSVPAEELTPSLLEHEVVVARRTLVDGVADHDHPVVSFRSPFDDRERGIGGRVVRHDQLQITVRLRQHALDRLLEVPLAVVHRQTDRHPRRRLGHVGGHIDHSPSSSPLNSRIAATSGCEVLAYTGPILGRPLRRLDRSADEASDAAPVPRDASPGHPRSAPPIAADVACTPLSWIRRPTSGCSKSGSTPMNDSTSRSTRRGSAENSS